MSHAGWVDAEVFGGVAGVVITADGDRGRAAVAAERDLLVLFRDPAAEVHRHTVGSPAISAGPGPDVTVFPGRGTDGVVACARGRRQQLFFGNECARSRTLR